MNRSYLLLPTTRCCRAALLLMLICTSTTVAQYYRTVFIGTIGSRRAQLYYDESRGRGTSRDGWLIIEGDTLPYRLSIPPVEDVSTWLTMYATAHGGRGLDIKSYRAGRLEGDMNVGLGRFDGFWYGVDDDTARVKLRQAAYYYKIRIAPFEELVTEWDLPVFVRSEEMGLEEAADRLNGELHRWMDEMLARNTDSCHAIQANELRMFREDPTYRRFSRGKLPRTYCRFKVRGWINWCSKDVLSVILDCSSEHGTDWQFEGWTYQISGDTIRRLTLVDLFSKGVDIRRALYEWGKRTATIAIDSVFTARMNPAADDAAYERIIRSFSLRPEGITFYLRDPFEPEGSLLGPYYTIQVPYRELEALIDPDGALARFVKTR